MIENGIFCNGANFSYRKQIFIESEDVFNTKIASGDDVFLMHYVKRKHPSSIVFAKDKDSIVTTFPKDTFKEFINQRKRWSAKSISYKDKSNIIASLIVFLINISVVLLLIFSFFNIEYLYYFILVIASKAFVDIVFLIPVLKFFNRERLIKFIFPFEIIYSLYIIMIVIVSFTNSFQWKGRTYKR